MGNILHPSVTECPTPEYYLRCSLRSRCTNTPPALPGLTWRACKWAVFVASLLHLLAACPAAESQRLGPLTAQGTICDDQHVLQLAEEAHRDPTSPPQARAEACKWLFVSPATLRQALQLGNRLLREFAAGSCPEATLAAKHLLGLVPEELSSCSLEVQASLTCMV